MSSFVDNSNYYFNITSEDDGVYLESHHPTFTIKLDPETLAYYFKHYTIQKGTFSNGFRKILCNDGLIRYFNKEHPEHIEAVKLETISIKDIDEGIVLADNNGHQYIYIGSFYKDLYRDSKRKRWHYFYRKDRKELSFRSDLKKFKAILGTDVEYTSNLVNYEKLLTGTNHTDVHLTQS